jgi:hypothetical protein
MLSEGVGVKKCVAAERSKRADDGDEESEGEGEDSSLE